MKEIRAHVRSEAEHKPPFEACGYVVKNYETGQREVIRCQNVSRYPKRSYQIGLNDAKHALKRGSPVLVYHSHPFGRAKPSLPDLRACQETAIPFLIWAWPRDEHVFIKPDEFDIPLDGRPFEHGVLDCYSYCRDYLRMVHGIEIPNFYRPDEWWRDGKSDLYVDNFRAAGFVEVNRSPTEVIVDDFLLQQVSAQVVNHASVYIGAGRVAHHRFGRLSGKEFYSPEVQSQVRYVIRHKDML